MAVFYSCKVKKENLHVYKQDNRGLSIAPWFPVLEEGIVPEKTTRLPDVDIVLYRRGKHKETHTWKGAVYYGANVHPHGIEIHTTLIEIQVRLPRTTNTSATYYALFRTETTETQHNTEENLTSFTNRQIEKAVKLLFSCDNTKFKPLVECIQEINGRGIKTTNISYLGIHQGLCFLLPQEASHYSNTKNKKDTKISLPPKKAVIEALS